MSSAFHWLIQHWYIPVLFITFFVLPLPRWIFHRREPGGRAYIFFEVLGASVLYASIVLPISLRWWLFHLEWVIFPAFVVYFVCRRLSLHYLYKNRTDAPPSQ